MDAPHQKTILVVEDDTALSDLLCTSLERHGHAVLRASESGEAIALVSVFARAIDLLVTDLVLPRGGGRLLVQSLIELGLDVPVLYLSDRVEAPADLPGNRSLFLGKPFELAELDWAVAHLLRQ